MGDFSYEFATHSKQVDQFPPLKEVKECAPGKDKRADGAAWCCSQFPVARQKAVMSLFGMLENEPISFSRAVLKSVLFARCHCKLFNETLI